MKKVDEEGTILNAVPEGALVKIIGIDGKIIEGRIIDRIVWDTDLKPESIGVLTEKFKKDEKGLSVGYLVAIPKSAEVKNEEGS